MNSKALALLAFAPLLPFLAPATLLAQGETHGPHVHGAATLNITVEDASIDIDLDGPLASFISFEHVPSTPEQTAEMKAMVDKLNGSGSLFAFPAAWGCKPSGVTLDGENIPEDILGHPHSAEGHGHGHEGEEGHSHDGEDEGHEHADGEVHSDLEAEFEFACTTTVGDGALIDAAGLFEAFPSLLDVDVQLVSSKGQKGAELSPTGTKITW
ncbi:MAG: DUF2796 domain-containing protein [Deltaproteobacteria bacterium]|jgi:hypothetical protein|nr:DUF2796 domain-containing protein [Deltaproteobacteria bacterium]